MPSPLYSDLEGQIALWDTFWIMFEMAQLGGLSQFCKIQINFRNISRGWMYEKICILPLAKQPRKFGRNTEKSGDSCTKETRLELGVGGVQQDSQVGVITSPGWTSGVGAKATTWHR